METPGTGQIHKDVKRALQMAGKAISLSVFGFTLNAEEEPEKSGREDLESINEAGCNRRRSTEQSDEASLVRTLCMSHSIKKKKHETRF